MMQKSRKVSYSLYIHVPFCRQACSYCDFYFVTRQELIPEYKKALLQEIKSTAKAFRDLLVSADDIQPVLTSVYFGGGTPSRLPASDIAHILEAIHTYHGLDDVLEITLEANPDDLSTLQNVLDLKKAGITRLSMGIQSFNPDLLTFMHRAHKAEDAARSLDFIEKAAFDTHTVDLIYGNPGQSLDQLEEDIRQFLSFDPPHISAYALTIEPGTRLGKAVSLGRLSEPDDNDVARHMELVSNTLQDAGLERYEVSNFAKPGHEAVHNSSYWNHTPYLGIGPGAHSLHLTADAGGVVTSASRWSAPADLRTYILHYPKNDTPFVEGNELLTLTQLAEERILMGLRTRNGLSLSELHSRYNYVMNNSQIMYINKMQNEGFISGDALLSEIEFETGNQSRQQHIRFTEKGYPLADHITLEILTRLSHKV